ncbi:hypothetical protein EON79_08425 [bacterium]|nr:MAG: hypothetical protein EON79_08425 [bacterium]
MTGAFQGGVRFEDGGVRLMDGSVVAGRLLQRRPRDPQARLRSRHGLVAAEWLAGRLPEDALQAIRAHDHRTGEVSDTPLGIGLRMTDALAVMRDDFGPELPALLANPDELRRRCAHRPWLPKLLLDGAEKLGVSAAMLGDIARAGA